MLAEFFASLQQAAQTAAKPTVIPVKGLHSRVLLGHSAGHEWVDVESDPRHVVLESLESLIAFATNADVSPRPEVYLGWSEVRVICDRDERRGYGRLLLRKSKRWEAVEKLTESVVANVPAIRRFLRFDLAAGDELRTALGRVDFSRKSDGSSSAAHGRETLGRAVEARVQNAEAIPESFLVSVPAFAVAGLEQHVEVRVQVELHPQQEQVELRVLGDDYERARAAALLIVRNKLVAAGFGGERIPMFDGHLDG